MFHSWQGVVISAAIDTFTIYSVHREGDMARCSSLWAQSDVGGGSTLLALEVVQDHGNDLYAPFLLARAPPQPSAKKDCTHQLWKYSERREVLELCTSFEAPLGGGDAKFRITHGPVVSWSDGQSLHLHKATRHVTLSLRSYLQLPAADSLMVSGFWTFGSRESDGEAATVMARVEMSSEGGHGTRTEWLCLEAKLDGTSNTQRVAANRLVPSDYGRVATCISFHTSHVTVRSEGCISATHLIAVGTSRNQVVVFEEGRLKHVISIQATPNMVDMHSALGGQVVVIVHDDDDNVYVHVTSGEQLEQFAWWKGVSTVLIGDFINQGHDQMLVIYKQEGMMLKPDVCSIVEFGEFPAKTSFDQPEMRKFPTKSSSDQWRVEEVECKMTNTSLCEAFRALDVRRKLGDLYLCELEKELENKSQLLEQGLQVLRDLQHSPLHSHLVLTPDPTLVTFLPGKFPDSCNGCSSLLPSSNFVASTPTFIHTVTVIYQWQRLLDQQWVIGTIVRCQKKPLANLTITPVFLTGHDNQLYSCKQVWFEEDGDLAEKMVLKSRRPAENAQPAEPCASWKACLVTYGPVPMLENGQAEACLVCSWGGQHSGCMNVGSARLSIADFCSDALVCDDRCLELWQGDEDVVLKQPDFMSSQVQDLACLLAVRTVEKVKVTSTYSSLARIPQLLRDRLPSYVPVLPCSGCSTGTGPLGGVAFYVIMETTLTLSILHKNKSQLSLLMSMLHHMLPDDVCISAHDRNTKELTARALSCIEEELYSLSYHEAKSTFVRQCIASTDFSISNLLHSHDKYDTTVHTRTE